MIFITYVIANHELFTPIHVVFENGNYRNAKFETIAKFFIILKISGNEIIKFIKGTSK